MTASRCPLAGAILFIAVCGHASSLRAQGIEITPFGGYRFGGDFFELVTGQPVDADGAPAVGAIVDIPLGNGLQVEALFTHQNAHDVGAGNRRPFPVLGTQASSANGVFTIRFTIRRFTIRCLTPKR